VSEVSRFASSPDEGPSVIARLVLFGASGDLAGRHLLPALAALQAADELPERFDVVGAARANWDDEAFRRVAAKQLAEHASDVPARARDDLVRSLLYRPADLDDRASVASVLESGSGPLAAYLALPPALFATAITTLGEVGLPAGSRIVVEKPFGEDLAGAVTLNALLARVLGDAAERAAFRVDHVLGLATVQNLLAMRYANNVLEAVWNAEHIEQVEILWEEMLALEGRAGYFDNAGALKDVVENHLLQVLCLVAMETPPSFDERDLADRRLAVLRAARIAGPADTRRARYAAGRIGRREVRAYVDEDGVHPSRGTETFAELALSLDLPRWHGTRFVLRAGKALGQRRKELVISFRAPPGLTTDDGERACSELRIGLDGPDDLVMHLTGGRAGITPQLTRISLSGDPPLTNLPAYGRVLVDVLKGSSELSITGDEAEEAWRIVTPVLRWWGEGLVQLEEYVAGSSGPGEEA
jgi:glucose-6-phosphate 1-dehydrogenase